jgi:hypothetical protein
LTFNTALQAKPHLVLEGLDGERSNAKGCAFDCMVCLLAAVHSCLLLCCYRFHELGTLVAEIVQLIYQETDVREELVREVAMGPFKHRIDDGLDTRKAR